jgi:hypothetical protein
MTFTAPAETTVNSPLLLKLNKQKGQQNGSSNPTAANKDVKLVDPFNYVGEAFGSGPGDDYPHRDLLRRCSYISGLTH